MQLTRGAANAAARHDAFFNGRPCGVQSVLNARLFLLHLGLGGCAHFDDGDTAGELRQALLQFLAVVIGRRVFDLGAELLDAALDVACAPPPSTMVVLSLSIVTRLARPRSSSLMFSSLMPSFFADDLAAGQDGDVFQHRLATIAKAREP